MKTIVSISLGSSKRNHKVELEILGEKVVIERIGTDGDFLKMSNFIKQLDGQVDSIGLGGINLYLFANNKRYLIKDGLKLKNLIKKSFVSDGSLIKSIWEKKVVYSLFGKGIITDKTKSLVVSAVDRYSISEALTKIGCPIIFGDFLFALGIPLPLKTLRSVDLLASLLLPILTKLPISFLYPLGEKQDESKPMFTKYFDWADLIAGDFHFIKRYSPHDLNDKIILTNTVTHDDRDLLISRGVKILITTTPEWEGRSFGTNVIEGIMLSFLGKSADKVNEKEVEEFLDKISFKERIDYFKN